MPDLAGNPGAVTIFGQSAGGFGVNAMMASPLAKDLFARAIVESYPMFGLTASTQNLAQAEAGGQRFLAPVGAQALTDLRMIPSADLVRAMGASAARSASDPTSMDMCFPNVLQAVLCQQLLSHASGTGRVLASEILIVTAAIRNLIREQKIEQVQLAIQTGGKMGMQTMNQSLAELYRQNRITFQEAMMRSLDPEDLRRLMQRMGGTPSSRPRIDDRGRPARMRRHRHFC